MSLPNVILRVTVGVAVLATLAITGALGLGLASRASASAATPSVGQLSSQLGQEQARQQSLSSSLGTLSRLVTSLDGQIQLVQGREAAVRSQLASDHAELTRVHAALTRERARVRRLRRRLTWARMLLARQLVSGYERDKPDLVSVVLDARGFDDLLEQISFLGRAERQQQTVISFTRQAKLEADRAAEQLAGLQTTELRITQAATLRARALEGMNALLQSKQAALQQAQSAQQAALGASQARGRQLESRISAIRAQQLAAQRAAAAAAAAQAASSAPSVPTGPTLGPSGGWAIPYPIVLCESGGQDLPPNSAGASGYYQIIPSTWKLFGGTGPAAYLASKAEQDAVAARIWNGGAGASNWACAAIVGIH